MINPIEAISDYSARVTRGAVIVLACLLVLILLVEIFWRYVLGSALSWPEEVAIILVPWLIFLAGSLGVREDFHVRLGILTDRLPAPWRKYLEKCITLAITIFGAVLFYSGADLIARTAGNVTPSLRLPLELINYSAPVCGALIFLHGTARIFTEKKVDETD